MRSIANGLRFLVGMGLVAAGVTLAFPAGRLVAEAWSAGVGAGSHGSAMPLPPPPAIPPMAPVRDAAATPGQWLMPEESLPPPVVPRADYVPPPGPDRLPPVPFAAVAQAPDLNGTYRSTLQVPPPPLLDAQSPPPAAASWDVQTQPQAPASTAAVQEPAASTYVIRDGDDLAGISSRFYGHPGAAAAVWSANRDRIPNPDLLPIGTEIRLPPPWTVPGIAAGVAGGIRSIEPPRTHVSPRAVEPVSASAAWLDGRQPEARRDAPMAAASHTVRLGPGDTLETLAERFYGDRRAASRIWEANRDRLRSPELAVPGIELRLP